MNAAFAKLSGLWAKPKVRGTLATLFLILVCALIFNEARNIEWREVTASVRRFDGLTLAFAASLAALSYLFYSCFDLLGRHYTRVALSARTVMAAAFISFAVNQSLGTLIGSVGFRLRIYSRFGVSAAQTSTIIALSIVTNWLGYALLAGFLFVGGFVALPPELNFGIPGFDLGGGLLRIAGLLMLATALAYLAFCAMERRGGLKLFRLDIPVPRFSFAALQCLVSLLHWPATAGVIYVLLAERVEFVTILGGLLFTAVTVVITHIPAGIGILEAIFVALLRHRIPTPQILAALLVFRALYYLAPLTFAMGLYAKMEAGARNAKQLNSNT